MIRYDMVYLKGKELKSSGMQASSSSWSSWDVYAPKREEARAMAKEAEDNLQQRVFASNRGQKKWHPLMLPIQSLEARSIK